MVEAARWAPRAEPLSREEATARIRTTLSPLLESPLDRDFGDVFVAHPIADGILRVSVLPLAFGGGGGVALAASRPEFPTAVEMMMLSGAMNQLDHWLRIARLTADALRAEADLAERESSRLVELEDENAYLREEVEVARAFQGIVGQSTALRDVLTEIELVAPTDATVLILGESGTGKELLARAIHDRSRRAGRPLIKVNCSAVPREMCESEFFGHVRGAFTGAHRDRAGRFKLADKGSIFLDEVGDLPLDLQPKLLRVLQEGQYERVGGDTTQSVDVRVIAATNRDLAADVSAGRFREDLFYRLSVFPIRTPSLRDRRDDIALLANHFIDLVAKQIGKPRPELGDAQMAVLMRYDWPGNVRELQNVIERAVILARGNELRFEHVASTAAKNGEARRPPQSSSPPSPPPEDEIVPEKEWRRRERANLVAALARTSGRIYGSGGAAELLGVKPSTLQSRLRALGIRTRERD
jgi:transcriptional regulator with GAF, ATPase, and Fis domain